MEPVLFTSMTRRTRGFAQLQMAVAVLIIFLMGCSDGTGSAEDTASDTGGDSVDNASESDSGDSVMESGWAPHTIDQSLGVSDAAAGDLDGDGDVDIAVLAYGGFQTGWFENVNGAEEFVWHQIAADSAASIWDTKIKTADIDNDNDLDILASFADGTLRLWRNEDVSGTSWTEEMIALDFYNVFDFIVGDVNHDGDLDVAAVADGGTGPWVRWYSPPAAVGDDWIETIIETDHSSAFTSIDMFDSPATNEPVLLLFGSDLIKLTRNSDGTWEETKIPVWCRDTYEEELDLSDIDHDGDLDIVCPDGDDIYFYENLDGDFGEVSQHYVASIYNHSNRTGADIDDDGYPELLISNVGNCIIENPMANWDSEEEWSHFCLPSVSGSDLLRLDVADLDGDGDLDIYGTDAIGGMDTFPWFENPLY